MYKKYVWCFLKFQKPVKDACGICLRFKNELQCVHNKSEQWKNLLQTLLGRHIAEGDRRYKKYSDDKAWAAREFEKQNHTIDENGNNMSKLEVQQQFQYLPHPPGNFPWEPKISDSNKCQIFFPAMELRTATLHDCFPGWLTSLGKISHRNSKAIRIPA